MRPKLGDFDRDIVQYVLRDIEYLIGYAWPAKSITYPHYNFDINTEVKQTANHFQTTRAFIRNVFERLQRMTIEQYVSQRIGQQIKPYCFAEDHTMKYKPIQSAPGNEWRGVWPQPTIKDQKEVAWDKLMGLVKEAKADK
jgi:hypothetical protein